MNPNLNTIFEVAVVPESKELLLLLDVIEKTEPEPEFTDEERATVAENRKNQSDADAAAKRNAAAKSKLKLAKDFLKSGKSESARKWLQTIVKEFEDTDSVPEAKKLLKSLPEQRPAG